MEAGKSPTPFATGGQHGIHLCLFAFGAGSGFDSDHNQAGKGTAGTYGQSTAIVE
jgi:hypothetical protein